MEEIEVKIAASSEAHILRNLMELYLYDFSEFDGADPGADGTYGYPYLDLYWVEENRHPFLIRKDGKLAGFALVARYNYLSGESDCWVIAEFFVMRKYRGSGAGEVAAQNLFDCFPGDWQVGQIRENASATLFWRKVIQRYTGGNYEEVQLDNERWRGPVQMFRSPGTPVE
jgi:predicted acetyltransferase